MIQAALNPSAASPQSEMRRTLVRESGLKQGAAVEAMVQAIDCAK
jgi:hypothetical protein